MDSNSLQAFVTVADKESFSLAAEQLFLTQSAISKRIALLEEQLDSKLFDRIGRKVSLTEAGNTLLPQARQILRQLQDAKRSLHDLQGQVSGNLSMAASHHISLHRLPPVLRRFTKECPEVDLDLRFDASEIAYEGVLKGDLELALITLSPQPHKQIHAQKVWDDPLRYVVSPDHPLAGKSSVSLAELTAYNAILSGSATFTRQIAAQQFSHPELRLKTAMSTNYLDTIRMMVTIGLGWSLLPDTMINRDLSVLNVDAPPVSRQLGYISHKERTLSKAAQRFIEMLEANSGT